MYDFIIIGAAQAGLSMACELRQQGKKYLVLDKEDEVGASWLKRWDSLTLFTPSEFNHLNGMDSQNQRGIIPTNMKSQTILKLMLKNSMFQFDFKH